MQQNAQQVEAIDARQSMRAQQHKSNRAHTNLRFVCTRLDLCVHSNRFAKRNGEPLLSLSFAVVSQKLAKLRDKVCKLFCFIVR